MAENELSISIRADVSQLTAGLESAKTAVAQAGSAMAAAVTPAAALAASLKNQGLSAEEAASALKNLGYSAATAAAAAGVTSSAMAKTAVETEAAATSMTRLEGAEAAAAARMAAMAAGVGGLGTSLGRVAAASSTLGPILANAFYALGAVALVDVLAMAIERFEKWRDLADQTAHGMTDLTTTIGTQSDELDLENLKLDAQIAKLEHKPDPNGPAIAFEEGRIAAEKFGKAVDDSLAKMIKLLGEGPGIFSSMALGRMNLSAISDQLKPLQLQYDMALAANDVEAQKNVLLQEQKILQEALAKEAQTHLEREQEAQRARAMGVVPLAPVNTEQDEASLFALNEALKAVNDELANFGKLKEIAAKSGTVSSDKAVSELEKETAAAEKRHAATAALVRRMQEEEHQLVIQKENFDREYDAFWTGLQAKETKAATKSLEEQLAADQKFHEGRMRDAEEDAVAAISLKEDEVREEYRLGHLSAQQAKDELTKLAADKHAIEEKYLTDRIAIYEELQRQGVKLDAEEETAYGALITAKKKLDIEYAKEKQTLNNQLATQEQKLWLQLQKQISGAFDQMIRGVLQGTQSIGQAFSHLAGDMLLVTTKSLLKQLAQHFATEAAKTAATATGTAARAGIETAHAEAGIIRSAKKAAAAAYADVPWPLNFVMAPIVFAAALAFGSGLPSAAGGWDMVPTGGALARLHDREMVLSAPIADSIRKMTSGVGGGFSSSSVPFAQGPEIHMHYAPTVHAIDSRGMKQALSKHGGDIAELLQREMREFRL